MLNDIAEGRPCDRSRDALIGQLYFNLGRLVELTNADGRAIWRKYEKDLAAADYKSMKM